MYKCETCKADNLFDAFSVGLFYERYLCVDCFDKHISGTDGHVITKTCSIEGCLELERSRDSRGSKLCFTHRKKLTGRNLCKRCHYKGTVDSLCTKCIKALHGKEIYTYRKMGTLTELEKAMQELQEYRALGTYNRLADAVSRQDKDDHCDELDLPEK